ncbi:MAG: TRAP transporter small permease [Rhodospirillales bacterium]|jgi:C4-dicarboxylate transporter DctQ subunit
MDDFGTKDAPRPDGKDRLAAVERFVIVTIFLALTAIGFLQIVNRHGLNLPVWNLEQLMPQLFIAMMFLGLPLLYRHRAYLTVDVVPDALPPRARRLYRLVLWIATSLFVGSLIYTTVDVIAFQLEINAVTNMGYPAAILTATLPVGAALALWRIWRGEIRPLLRGEDR